MAFESHLLHETKPNTKAVILWESVEGNESKILASSLSFTFSSHFLTANSFFLFLAIVVMVR